MRLTPYFRPGLITTQINPTSSTETIQAMVKMFEKNIPGLDAEEAISALLSRQQQVPTGLENGIAIPHATIDCIDDTHLGVALLPNAVDFGTRDGSLVRLVFMILSPKGAISTHIKLLARIARLCSDRKFVESLMVLNSPEDLLESLSGEDLRHV